LGGNPWLFIGLVFVVLISGWIILKRKIDLWEMVVEKTRTLDLTRREASLLKELARHNVRLSAAELVEHEVAFDSAAQSYLETLCGKVSPEKRQEVAGRVRSLRSKAGFPHEADYTHYGTRGIEPDCRLHLLFPEGNHGGEVSAKVEDSGGKYLGLKLLDSIADDVEGAQVRALVLADGGRYRVDTDVMKFDVDENLCWLDHRPVLQHAERRRSHRVVIGCAVRYRKQSEVGQQEAVLHDLSAHGAALNDAADLSDGEEVAVELRPLDYLPAVAARDFKDSFEVGGRVLELRNQRGKRVIPVEFEELEGWERERLHRLTRAIELHPRATEEVGDEDA
jgi:c-di-GMP-binding flagellar brake protein YcgR